MKQAAVVAPAWRLLRHDTLPSTSDACIAAAEAGEPEGLAIQARSQTRPRGSRGRSWSQAAGTLALSVLLRPHRTAAWPLIAGLALHEALGLTPAHREAIRLKWPNDVTLGGRKLGGILIEQAALPDGGGWLVIGFGANLAEAPRLADRQAACLAELGPVPDADRIADRLLAALLAALVAALGARCDPPDDAEAVRRDWLARAHPPGTVLAVRTAAGQTTGAFRGIETDGTLLLAVEHGIRRIRNGEIHLVQGA